MWKAIAISAALLVGGVTSSLAQDAAPVSNAGVARLSLLRGEVSTQRGDSGDWSGAALNAPLVSSDKLATTSDARAEVQLDFANLLRLAGDTQATLATLTSEQIQVQLGQGTADYVVLPNTEAAAEIDTPNLAVHPNGAGVYRIAVISDHESQVIVRSGDAEIATPQGSATLHAGQMITVEGTDEPQYQIGDPPPPDEWDSFNQQRDRAIQDAQSWNDANHYYTGMEDLDAYGHWVYVPGYGQVWAPDRMNADWTPYSVGRWVWEPYYGWTWVSSEPWGWAPYHYGRWFFYGASWVWWPGPVSQPRYRPIWAPAYVSFVGFGGGGMRAGVGVGFGGGFGAIGWLPIGPADPFRPWWGGAVVTRVNVVNVTNVTNVRVIAPLAPGGGVGGRVVYSNLDRMTTDPHIARAVVSVPSTSFGRGEVVRENVTEQQIRGGVVMGGTLPVVPTRESLRVSDRVVNTAALPRAAMAPEPHFYGTRPAAAAPPRFDAQAAAVQRTVAAGPGARPDPVLTERAGAAGGAASPRPAAGVRPGWSSFNGRGNARPTAGARPAASNPAPARSANPAADSPGRTSATAATPAPAASTERAAAPAAGEAHPPVKDGNWHSFNPPAAAKKPPAKPDAKKAPPPKDPHGGGGGGSR